MHAYSLSYIIFLLKRKHTNQLVPHNKVSQLITSLHSDVIKMESLGGRQDIYHAIYQFQFFVIIVFMGVSEKVVRPWPKWPDWFLRL